MSRHVANHPEVVVDEAVADEKRVFGNSGFMRTRESRALSGRRRGGFTWELLR